MKIKIKYINKTILPIIMVGSMVVPLSACSAGDDKVDSSKSESYSYEEVSEYQIIELETLVGTQIYLTERTGFFAEEYYDVFTDCCVYRKNFGKNGISYEADTFILKDVKSVKQYLVGYDFVKTEYSTEDLKTLLKNIEEDFSNQNQVEESTEKSKIKE